MANIIKVTPSKLESQAGKLDTKNSEIQKLVSEMSTLVSELNGNVWSGDANTAFKNQYNKLQDDINRMNKMIKEHADDLRKMAKAYRDAESKNKSLADSLKGDVIS